MSKQKEKPHQNHLLQFGWLRDTTYLGALATMLIGFSGAGVNTDFLLIVSPTFGMGFRLYASSTLSMYVSCPPSPRSAINLKYRTVGEIIHPNSNICSYLLSKDLKLNAPVPENLITVSRYKDITVMTWLYILTEAEITERKS